MILFIIGILCIPINLYFLITTINDGIIYNALLPMIGLVGGMFSIVGACMSEQ